MIGFFGMRIFLPSSASMDERDLCKKTDKKETNFEGDLFSEDYYRISVNDDNKNVISIERTAEISDIPKEQLYGEMKRLSVFLAVRICFRFVLSSP